MKPAEVTALAIVVAAFGLLFVSFPHAAPAARYVVGKTYVFAWDCLPAGTVEPPCYWEPLTVRKVHEDGWLDVVDARDSEKSQVWTVNPARAIGHFPMVVPGERQASR